MISSTTTLSPRILLLGPLAEAPSFADEPRRLIGLFRGWLLARTLLWTLLATLTQHAPPLDTVEWLCWGRQWQLGYYKHPPLAAWVAEIACRLTPGSFLGVYLAGYTAIAVALWCVWRLARTMLPPREALAATVCLDGLVFFGQAAAEFNNQVLLIAFWALAVLLFHRALTHDRWRDWIGTGLALGLALLCKYSVVFLIIPLLGLWLWRNGLRRSSRPVLVALTAALVFLPHFVWLCRHDFPTLRYAALRAAGETEAYDHRLSAVTFLLTQGLRLLPVALVLAPLLRRRDATGLPRGASRSSSTGGRSPLDATGLPRGASRSSSTGNVRAPAPDATGLPRGASRSSSTGNVRAPAPDAPGLPRGASRSSSTGDVHAPAPDAPGLPRGASRSSSTGDVHAPAPDAPGLPRGASRSSSTGDVRAPAPDAPGLPRGASRSSSTGDVRAPAPDATGLPRGGSRSTSTGDAGIVTLHGTSPWHQEKLSALARDEREAPRDKPVASQREAEAALVDDEREAPRDKPVASQREAGPALLDDEREAPRDKPVASQREAEAALVDDEREAPRDKPVASQREAGPALLDDERETPRDKPVASQREVEAALVDDEREAPRDKPVASSSDRVFVVVVVLGPVALHLAASLGLGVTLRDIWGAPLWTFAGLLALLFVDTDTTERKWRRFGLAWAGVTALTLALVVAGNLAGGRRGKPSRIHYPGAELAAVLSERWQERFGTPVPIVAGDWWLAGLVCCHAPHRPSLYASLEPAAFGVDPNTRPGDPRRYANPDPRTSPWTGDADLLARGGLLVWDADCYGADIPEWLRQRFPTARTQSPLELDCAAGGPVLRVGWAMIAPTETDS